MGRPWSIPELGTLNSATDLNNKITRICDIFRRCLVPLLVFEQFRTICLSRDVRPRNFNSALFWKKYITDNEKVLRIWHSQTQHKQSESSDVFLICEAQSNYFVVKPNCVSGDSSTVIYSVNHLLKVISSPTKQVFFTLLYWSFHPIFDAVSSCE